MNRFKRLFLSATNVHQGGGAILLRAILEADFPFNAVCAHLDTRLILTNRYAMEVAIRRVRPTILHRLLSDWRLARSVSPGDTVLCFGNLPPLFKCSGRVFLFIQNRYLIEDVSIQHFPFKARLRLHFERLWLSVFSSNAKVFIVQTPSMESALRFSGKAMGKRILVLPFVFNCDGYKRSLIPASFGESRDSAFLYVASGEPHKNHRNLVEAWCLLAQEGLFPVLWLTLDENIDIELLNWLEQRRQHFCLSILNFGRQSHEEVRQLYSQVEVLIFPSTLESFGLPLIEARQAGLAVLASELDFVRDVLDPEHVFDPKSPLSIARAVKRYLGVSERPLPLMNASEFIDFIFRDYE
jgi:glycosyltransferase involved in cell wall biosynthesis